jgi:hypothetical protein
MTIGNSGVGAGIPHLAEFFRERLQLPVEFFDPLRKVAVAGFAGGEEMASSKYLLGEPVGLALRAATACPIELNLRPASVRRRQDLEKRRPFLIAAGVCFVLGLLGWGAYYARGAQVVRHRTEQIEQRVTALRRVETQMNEARKRMAALDGLAAPLVSAINDRSFWPQIIEELNERLPKEDIWITELAPTSPEKTSPAPNWSMPDSRTHS